MTLFFRKDNGFGKTATFLSVTQIGILENRTIVEIKIVCISEVIRNGMMALVVGLSNLCVKSMLEINQQNFFLLFTFDVAQHVDE